MARTITYYPVMISPYTYLGHDNFAAMAAKYGAEVDVRPMDMMMVFQEIGSKPPAQRHPNLMAYRGQELTRWAKRLNKPFNLKPAHFPVPMVLASACVIIAKQQGTDVMPMTGSILKAVWAEDKNISEPDTLAAIMMEHGLDAAAILAEAGSEKGSALVTEGTKQAIANGIFGAPTYVLDGEMFWGQDRLFMLEEKLAG